jgi:hypothetical protein
MSEYLHATTASDECKLRKAEALQMLKHLRVAIDGLEHQLQTEQGDAIHMGWAKSVFDHATNVYNTLAMSNGAATVRGTKREK